ncbi:hypothetical protein RJ640_021163 [Escallonia rubra]|uniref:Uncharacterized protein n=1 Tax=Escallonia rubra TaxID=112253 RepID=A0AA88R1K9_9ASTE|nr:hypothetical protein RJ640_021163 [Escallonia rubra]
MDYYMETIGKFGPINLSALIQSHSKKFSCIINNPFVPWVSDVAAKHEILCAMLWIQPCTLYAIYYRFYNSLNSFPTLENPQMNVELPGLPSLCTEDLPSFILPSSSLSSFPKMLCGLFQDMKKLKWVLGNSFQELETDVIEAMDEIHPIWPIESITAGVPIIAYPQWTDQPTNAKLITDVLQIGVRLTKNQEGLLGSEEVEKCIQEIMSGPRSEEYKTNAAKLKEAAREAVADGGSSDRNIQLFVDEIIGNC